LIWEIKMKPNDVLKWDPHWVKYSDPNKDRLVSLKVTHLRTETSVEVRNYASGLDYTVTMDFLKDRLHVLTDYTDGKRM